MIMQKMLQKKCYPKRDQSVIIKESLTHNSMLLNIDYSRVES